MPRISTALALLVPLVAIFFVLRSSAFARVQLSSWPFAFHPDEPTQDAAQAHLQRPFEASDPPSHDHSHKAHQHLNANVGDKALRKGGFTRRIVAVGDLHGDLGNAYKVLHMAGVVDEEGAWSGGVDFFVQTGDIIDRSVRNMQSSRVYAINVLMTGCRGDDTIKLYALMDSLREQAPQKGGTVLTHLGNHEWMNVIGDWRYVPFTLTVFFVTVLSHVYADTSTKLKLPPLGPPKNA